MLFVIIIVFLYKLEINSYICFGTLCGVVVELIAAWLGLCTAILDLKASRIFLEGDSAIVVSYLKAIDSSHKSNNSFLQDIAT